MEDASSSSLAADEDDDMLLALWLGGYVEMMWGEARVTRAVEIGSSRGF